MLSGTNLAAPSSAFSHDTKIIRLGNQRVHLDPRYYHGNTFTITACT